MFKSKRSRTAADEASIRSNSSSLRDGAGGREVSDLGLMSVPYDRLTPGAKPASSTSGRYISSPNTNPTLTADGTALNLYADQLPTRRESNHRAPSPSPGAAAHPHRESASETGSIRSVGLVGQRPIPEGGGPTRTPSQASSFRTTAGSSGGPGGPASLRGPNGQQHHAHHHSSSAVEHAEFGSSSSRFSAAGPGPSTAAAAAMAAGGGHPHRPQTPHESNGRSSTPQPSLSARPSTSMSTHSSGHGRNNSSSRYPTFNPSDASSIHTVEQNLPPQRPPPSSSVSGIGPGGGSRYSFMGKGELTFVSETFDYPKPAPADFDAAFESFIPEVLSQTVAHGYHSSAKAQNPTPQSQEAAAQQLRALPPDKKWTLMHGIAKEKWERARAKQAGAAEAAGTGGGSGAGGAREAVQSDVKPTVKDEPEKFVKMFLDQRVEIRDVAALGVCLRTKPLDWQQEFLALHGPRVITTALGNISNKRIQAGAFKPIDDKDRELEILKALATIFKDWRGLHYLEEQPQVLSAIAFSLTSPNLAARSLAIEILLIACTTLPHGHAKVISAMTDLNRLYKDKSGAVFGSWLRNLRETLGGRGRMGSLVGLSDELRRNLGSSAMGPAGDAALSDYASDSSLLMRTLQGHPEDIRVRCLIRNQLDEAGAQDIYALLRGFKRPDIDRQIDDMLYERRNDLAELEDVGDLPRVGPLEDPLEVFRGVLASVDGTQARDVFLGSLRSLLLIKPDDDIRLRYHQILNRVVASLVANDAVGMEEFNFSTLTGSNVNQLVGQFEEQERLDRARARAAEMTATAQELALQKAALEEQLALGGAGQTAQLTEKLGATEALLKGSRLATQKLQADMDEMREAYEKRIASLEAKIMELFAMLKEDRQLGGVIAKADGSVDRQQLLDSLERQEEIRKTIEKLEGAHRKQRRRRSGRLPVGRSGFDDDTDEEDATGAGSPDVASAPLAPPVASSSVAGSPASAAPKPPAKSKARRSEVKSGSQFVDAEDEIVREHIEASIVAGLSSSHSPNNGPRSARQRGDLGRGRSGHPLLNNAGTAPSKPFLAPRFVEELKGRRFSRSASAPVTGQDLDDARSEASSSSRRESGFTSATFSTQATSHYSHSFASPHNRDGSLSSVAAGSSKHPGLSTLDESRELRPAQSDRPHSPVSPSPAGTAALHGVGDVLNFDVDKSALLPHAAQSPSSGTTAMAPKAPSPEPPMAMARPANPFAAGLMAQIASKRQDGDDESESNDTPAQQQRPPKPSFLADINGAAAKRSQAADDQPAGPPRPAFLAGIAGGLSGLKAAGARGGLKSTTDADDEGVKPTLNFGAFLRPVEPSAVVKAPRKDVAYKASAKVRQLHWDKVAEIKTDTPNVWAITTAEAPENEWAEKMKQFDIWSQMETTFSSMEAKKLVDKERQAELMSVLDPKVRKLVEIFMKGYKIDDPEELRVKLLACDEKYCTHNFLENLSKFLPNPEQVGKLNAHKSDTMAELMLLHPADRLMVQLIKIPRLAARVEGMLYRARFEERIAMLEEAVEQTYEASQALQDAPKFRQLLSLILMIGNYLNGNSYAGGAFGFKIASINKLVETKSPQGQNLLHFVERTVSSLFHDMEGFMDELDKASEGSRHELQPVGKARAELSEKLAAIDKEIKDHLADEPIPGDRYAQRMIRFLADARDRIDALNDRRIMTESTYNETLRYFNEDPTTPSNVFFGIFKTFLTSYKQCQKQNLSWAEMEAAKQRRREAAERQAAEKAARKAKQDEQAPAIENIMESLRAMAPRRRRAGQRGSEVEPSAAIPSSLSLDLGAETADDTFGSQALSILNTLRQKGFSSSESEPVLPRTSRLSASRLVDLSSRLEQKPDAAPTDGVSPTVDEDTLSTSPTEAIDGSLSVVTESSSDHLLLMPVAEESAVDELNLSDYETPAQSSDEPASQPAAPATAMSSTDQTESSLERDFVNVGRPLPKPSHAASEPAETSDLSDAPSTADRPFSLADLGNFSFEGGDLDTTLHLPHSPSNPPKTTP